MTGWYDVLYVDPILDSRIATQTHECPLSVKLYIYTRDLFIKRVMVYIITYMRMNKKSTKNIYG